MGCLTEIVLLNDAMHEFKQDPKEFGLAVLNCIDKANTVNKQASAPFQSYCNYIRAEPSRHADHTVMFIHSGNGLTAVGKNEQDWIELIKRDPDGARGLLQTCKFLLKQAGKALPPKTPKQPKKSLTKAKE